MSTRHTRLTNEQAELLEGIADKLLCPGKGIVAAEYNTMRVTRLLDCAQLPKAPENVLKFFDMLYQIRGLETFASGVIFSEDVAFEVNRRMRDDESFTSRGIAIGFRSDKRVQPILGTNGEFVTLGLDGLSIRCQKFKEKGYEFSEFKCVFKISENSPSSIAMRENARILACFASICQICGVLPIVQVDILRHGNFDLDHCERVTEKVLANLFISLNDYDVYLKGMLLKTNFIVPGDLCTRKYKIKDLVKATLLAFHRQVPVAIPGILFSSSDIKEMAIKCLQAFNTNSDLIPWTCTFDFGYALIDNAILLWCQNPHNFNISGTAFTKKLQESSCASRRKFGECIAYEEEFFRASTLKHVEQKVTDAKQEYLSTVHE